jgi:hypothetical protein
MDAAWKIKGWKEGREGGSTLGQVDPKDVDVD